MDGEQQQLGLNVNAALFIMDGIIATAASI
jgi:hypothetical protein